MATETKAKAKAKATNTSSEVQSTAMDVPAPNIRTLEVHIVGTAPYVQNKFSQKARTIMRDKQEQGDAGKAKKKKSAKNFKECYEDAKHVSPAGWCGIPAAAFRCALISACRTCGIVMTKAKLAAFVEADGFDVDDGTPLVKITKGKPTHVEHTVRLETGVCDIRARPMWAEGWEAKVRIRYDADMLSQESIVNLMMRAGCQVGIGEGRPDSKKSAGMGWGTFSFRDEKGTSR